MLLIIGLHVFLFSLSFIIITILNFCSFALDLGLDKCSVVFQDGLKQILNTKTQVEHAPNQISS